MSTPPVPLWSLSFVRAYVVTMRPYLLFVSGAAALVGLSFLPEPAAGRVVLAFVPLFLSYGLGQALTDCFQTDTDSISAPYRPLVAGVVSKRQVLSVSLVGLTVVVLVLAYLNPMLLLMGAAAVVGLLTYTYFKRTWWGGPPWNSWIVAVIPIMGRMVDTDYRLTSLVRPEGSHATAFALAVLAVFFGYANFVVMGYFKDISADAQTGYRTFPVVFGWRPTAVYGDLTAAASAALTAIALWLVGVNAWAAALFVAGLAMHLHAQVVMHRIRDESRTGTAIANGVRAFVLYCLAVSASNHAAWTPLLLAFYVLFELTLRIRPERGQV